MFANAASAHEAADPSHPMSGANSQPSATGLTGVERGRYVVKITGCNDCHTVGYAEHGGTVPVSDWLTGATVGFKGPWGVSYPANLRLTVQSMTEEQWLHFARTERLPPMPWFALRDMSDDDLRAVYGFIRSLGSKGARVPAAVAPGAPVNTPFIVFVPQTQLAATSACGTTGLC
jgi:mono/diheme cytochrome c family protein